MRILPLVAVFLAVATQALACGPETDCIIGDRTYRIALPEGPGPYGAIVFMHGWRGSAAGEMANASLRKVAAELGVALVAPKSGGEDWLLANAPRRGLTDDALELAPFDALLDDISARYPIDPSRLMAAGFSAGGMMTWTLACHRPDRFAAFVPISGTFWAPVPAACAEGRPTLIHIHGTTDTVVPLDGRPIADARQGRVEDALALFRAKGYGDPAAVPAPESLACTGERATSGDAELVLCTHGGGHVFDPDWIRWAWQRAMPAE
jgi:polyhydroxybutyrate depolymerase